MGHVTGTTFGIGTPTTFAAPATSWGLSPYVGQAYGVQPFPQQPYLQPFSNAGFGIGAGQPVPPILQTLQIIPQQLQQLQVIQQQVLLQLQQLSQLVPAQLHQLQQLVQVIPQHVQYLQQQQPYGSTISGPAGFGPIPQAFAGQGASYVM